MYCFDYLELQRPKAGVFWEAAFGSLHLERRTQKGWPCSLHPSYLSFQHCDTPCNDDSFGHLQQDEYHMLHLVCASRTPPSSPKPPRSLGNKPQETSAGPVVSLSLAFLLISSVAALLSSPTSLLKHTHAHLPEVCGLIYELRSKLWFLFFFCSRFRTLTVLPRGSTASRLQREAVMDSETEVDLSLTTICIYSICKSKIL